MGRKTKGAKAAVVGHASQVPQVKILGRLETGGCYGNTDLFHALRLTIDGGLFFCKIIQISEESLASHRPKFLNHDEAYFFFSAKQY